MIEERNKKKYFSVLGDSISTLAWYTEPEGAAFYDGENKRKANVYVPEDTWWGQVISHFCGELLVNNSFLGSKVCKGRGVMFPSYACSDERTSSLGKGDRLPDVIMIFMGINDWGAGVKPLPENDAEKEALSVFSVAYQVMLEKLQKNYPDAELWCFTLPVSICKKREDFVFPYRYAGRHIEEYCEVIRACAKRCGCCLVDLYRYANPHDTIDGFHPNDQGMKTLADAVIAQMMKEV